MTEFDFGVIDTSAFPSFARFNTPSRFSCSYTTIWWEQECNECGKVVTHTAGTEDTGYMAGYICPEHGFVGWKAETAQEYCEVHGYTDPSNPYGGWKNEIPWDLRGDELRAWFAENVTFVEFDNTLEAAEFIQSFPGGVWDWSDQTDGDRDYRTGKDTTVWLHIEDGCPEETLIFNLATRLQEQADASRKAFNERNCA